MKIHLLQRYIGGITGGYTSSVRAFSNKEAAEHFQKQVKGELQQLLADTVMRSVPTGQHGGRWETIMTVNDCLASIGVTQLTHVISEFDIHESGLVVPATKLILPS